MIVGVYRKKPVTIEAVKFEYPPSPGLLAWLGDSAGNVSRPGEGALAEIEIFTLEDGSDGRARHVATEGDLIIKGVKGEFYPCKPDIFDATYSFEKTLFIQLKPEGQNE